MVLEPRSAVLITVHQQCRTRPHRRAMPRAQAAADLATHACLGCGPQPSAAPSAPAAPQASTRLACSALGAAPRTVQVDYGGASICPHNRQRSSGASTRTAGVRASARITARGASARTAGARASSSIIAAGATVQGLRACMYTCTHVHVHMHVHTPHTRANPSAHTCAHPRTPAHAHAHTSWCAPHAQRCCLLLILLHTCILKC